MRKHHHKEASSPPSAPVKVATMTAPAAVIEKERRNNPASEEAIRECAYYHWESAGKPDGDGCRFWFEAENELNSRK